MSHFPQSHSIKTPYLIIFFIMISMVCTTIVHAQSRQEIKQMVIDEALNSNVPPALALAVAKIESDFQSQALSHAGARGVMQIMPQTAMGEYGVHADELWNPRLNIQLGIDFLEHLYKQYNGRWDLALSHYNGGTIKNNRPHSYTKNYIANVQRWQQRYSQQASLWRANNTQPQQQFQAARTKVTKYVASQDQADYSTIVKANQQLRAQLQKRSKQVLIVKKYGQDSTVNTLSNKVKSNNILKKYYKKSTSLDDYS